MKTDLVGRIANTRLPNQQALLPIYEAVVNAIHSCNDAGGDTPPSIEVKLFRSHEQGILSGTAHVNAIETVEITDNGRGFDEANFHSFQTADSRHRIGIGGKGIGRFLWLVAFSHAEIDSTFVDQDGNWQKRTFHFTLTPEGVEAHTLVATDERTRKTTIRLVTVREKFQKGLPKTTLAVANRIVEHCLQYFLLGLAVKISISDDSDNERLFLADLYRAQVEAQGKAIPVQVSGRTFQLHHIRVRPTYGEGHRLYFCADKRLVTSEKLEGKLPNLETSIKDDGGKPFVYSGYISGSFLDETVNAERTDFAMPDENSSFGDPTWQGLVGKCASEAKAYLEPYTASLKQEKEARIKEYVMSKAPAFRPLVKHRPAMLDSIPLNLPDDKLDVELYKLNQDYEKDLREHGERLVAATQETNPGCSSSYNAFLEEWNESGIAKLANHVAFRKATLRFLRQSIGLNRSGKYPLEEAVHKIICPLRTSSDDIPADQMNLWIIDERLAYHFYLASDVPFKSLREDILQVDSADRTDLLIFNSATAFVDEEAPYSSVVIVEFKRPARNDYTDEENPINQVYRYVKQIRDGRAHDRRGRPINVPAHIPFYAYIIADITPNLRDQASFSGFQPNHDNTGFLTFNPQLRTYVELISFDNLVSNAEKRNKFFFDQLNLPS